MIATENYVIILADDSSVVSVEEQATAKIPLNLAGVALAYPLKGFVWTIGDVHIPGKADSFDLRPTKALKPVDTAKPGQSLMVIYLPKVTAPPELIAKLKTPPPPKKNTSDTQGSTRTRSPSSTRSRRGRPRLRRRTPRRAPVTTAPRRPGARTAVRPVRARATPVRGRARATAWATVSVTAPRPRRTIRATRVAVRRRRTTR